MEPKRYKVKIDITATATYDVEADSLADAKQEAEALADSCEPPSEVENVEIRKVHKPERVEF